MRPAAGLPPDAGRSGVAPVERGGEARVVHMKVSANNLRDVLVRHADCRSRLHIDKSSLYPKAGAEFAAHRRQAPDLPAD